MRNKWMQFFSGNVKVRVTGRMIELFMNACARNEIIIWDVTRVSETVYFYMKLKDISRMREIAPPFDCEVSVERRFGLPFLGKKSLRNSGFVIGIFLFLGIIFLLSNMVWRVEVSGAKPETEHLLRKELAKLGVSRGAFQFTLDSPETIQRKLTTAMDVITWVGVERTGTMYSFRVVEKTIPKPKKIKKGHIIVAKKKAIITKMYVKSGQALVTVHQHVVAGQPIVSGMIGVEEKQTFVGAEADVYGETWYRAATTLPLTTTFHVLNGQSITKHYLHIETKTIPIWGFEKNTFKRSTTESTIQPFNLFKWTLPIYYEKKVVREREMMTRKYKVNDAYKTAIAICRTKVMSTLPAGAKIKSEKVLRKEAGSGKVSVEVHYQVIENIGAIK